MIPQTVSPKCTSLTVVTVASRSPRRGSVRNSKPSMLVVGVGLEVAVGARLGAVVDDGLVVGDGGELRHLGIRP